MVCSFFLPIQSSKINFYLFFAVNDELKEQIEDVSDSADPSSSGSDDTLDAASANLLLQAILSVGGKQTAALYGLVGLLDRYSEVLRGVSLPENEKSHAVLLKQSCCDGVSGFYVNFHR